jgi:putative flavoprotein involved in K+ transport
LGLSWQHTRGSALLGFVSDDAAYIANQIADHHRADASASGSPEKAAS